MVDLSLFDLNRFGMLQRPAHILKEQMKGLLDLLEDLLIFHHDLFEHRFDLLRNPYPLQQEIIKRGLPSIGQLIHPLDHLKDLPPGMGEKSSTQELRLHFSPYVIGPTLRLVSLEGKLACLLSLAFVEVGGQRLLKIGEGLIDALGMPEDKRLNYSLLFPKGHLTPLTFLQFPL